MMVVDEGDHGNSASDVRFFVAKKGIIDGIGRKSQLISDMTVKKVIKY